MRMKVIAAAVLATSMLAACDTNDGPMEEAGESVDEAVEQIDGPDTLEESIDEAAEDTSDAIEEMGDDIDGAVDETGEAMEEATDTPQ